MTSLNLNNINGMPFEQWLMQQPTLVLAVVGALCSHDGEFAGPKHVNTALDIIKSMSFVGTRGMSEMSLKRIAKDVPVNQLDGMLARYFDEVINNAKI